MDSKDEMIERINKMLRQLPVDKIRLIYIIAYRLFINDTGAI